MKRGIENQTLIIIATLILNLILIAIWIYSTKGNLGLVLK